MTVAAAPNQTTAVNRRNGMRQPRMGKSDE